MAQWLSELSVGQWFEADSGQFDGTFEIVGIDASSEIVLAQSFDGTLIEVDFETWIGLAARACAPPEDYSGALDIEHEDYDLARDDEVAVRARRWDSPLDHLEG